MQLRRERGGAITIPTCLARFDLIVLFRLNKYESNLTLWSCHDIFNLLVQPEIQFFKESGRIKLMICVGDWFDRERTGSKKAPTAV